MTAAGTVPTIGADRFRRATFDVRPHSAAANAASPSSLVTCIVGCLVRPLLETGSLGAGSPPAG